MPALRTYDVFDTAVTRIIAEPKAVFLLLGHAVVRKGIWSGTPDQFAVARIDAETRARIHSGRTEVLFAAIYAELGSAYALAQEAVARISEMELTLEASLLRAVPETMRNIQAARERGDVVQFISDMYLPHAVVHSWLVSMGIAHPTDRLWLSSEHGVTKSRGDLFDVVGASKPATIASWIHEGDNAHSDIAVPSARGLPTRHFTACHLTHNEQVMEGWATATCGLSSLLAGAGRWARLNRPVDADVALQEFAAGVGAPVIYAFVLWVVQEVQRRGLSKLWFMARDGQVMLPIARTIARKLGVDVEMGYLYGGRQVVRVASLTSIDEKALEWLTGGAGVMTLQSVLDRVGLHLEKVRHIADSFGLPTDAPLGWESMDALRKFLQHPDVARLILGEAAERRGVVLDYFRACELIEGRPCAVIDIGWKGNVLRSIVDLIGLDEAARHTFMYFGSYAHAKGCEAVPRIAYLFDSNSGIALGTGEDIPSMTTIMEILCQADHGQVMRIERRGSCFEPVCRVDQSDRSASGWSVSQFQQVAALFAETVPIDRLAWASVDLRGMCDELLRRVATSPTHDEVELLAPIGFVDDQGGSQPHPFAHPYHWEHVRVAYRSGEAAPALGLNWWRAAAVSLTPTTVWWCMRAAAKAKRLQSARWFPCVRGQRALA